MRNRTALLLMALVALWLKPSPASAASDLGRRIDQYFLPFVEAGQFSGSVLVTNGPDILVERTYGFADHRRRPITARTRFPLASLSKAVTAAAIVDLQRRGRLQFNDPLARFAPSFPNARNITIEQLLRHQSGVGLIERPELFQKRHALADYVAEIAKAKPLFQPGEGDEYSNEGYILLAMVVQQASGLPVERYLSGRAFRNLRLRGVEFDHPGVARAIGSRAVLGGRPAVLLRDEAPLPGASGLQGTSRDIQRWMAALNSGAFGDYRRLPYPYGWGRRTYEGHDLLEQSGSVEGFGSYMASYSDGHYVVVLSNIQSGMQGLWGPDLAKVIYERGAVSRPPRFTPVADPHPLSDYAGDYANPGGGYPLRLRASAHGLEMTWGTYPFWRPVSVLGPDDLIALADYSRLRATRDRSGKVLSMMVGGLDGSTENASTFRRIGK